MVGNKYTFLPARDGEALDTLADITKAKELLEWSPTVAVEDWIRDNS